MNGLLYRAVASVHGKDAPKVHVFFEVPPLNNPLEELTLMLTRVWYTPWNSISIEHVIEECELLRKWARGAQTTGDARLFEVGVQDDGRIEYCEPGLTLFLASPWVLQRLVRGQFWASKLNLQHYKAPPLKAAA